MNNKFILKFYVNENGILEKETIPCAEGDINYKTLQHHVGGSMECVYFCDFGRTDLMAVVNEEGLLKHMKPTFYILDGDKLFTPYPLVGNVLIVSNFKDELHGLEAKDIDIISRKIFMDKQNYFLNVSKDYKKSIIETHKLLSAVGFESITVFPDQEIEEEYSL